MTFIAAAADTRLRALDSASGKTLWDAKLPAGGQATPSLYAVDGKQYVVIAAGGREGMGALAYYVVAYTLDGQGKEVMFQHGVAARMATLGIVALGVLASVVALWRRCAA
ncbi:hypothetical protein [Xanthomonas translucens]|uniref:Pyrrolo-quinoline quinone repeat domain-containing protein n=1 Tax=Xanthomonas translucens pv. translucens TaxID=134875 RepID=A0ABW9KSS3_XANCT|nr:hypothetical protein [Xanthomonas translucens]